MGMLEQLISERVWKEFYGKKEEQQCSKAFLRDLEHFIAEKAWLPVCTRIIANEPFPLPAKAVINKMHSRKKRIVYTYPHDENMVLKLLTHLLLRKYDGLFSQNLYSFRPGHGAKEAIRKITRSPKISEMYAYKADIRDYFNSIDLKLLFPVLKNVLAEDPALYTFLEKLLSEEQVLDAGVPVREKKGIMAGTPVSCFYANLFLRDLDAVFEERGILYARYADDIILFTPTKEEREEAVAFLHSYLESHRLSINPDKESLASPHEPWVFLGCVCQDGVLDIAPASVVKIKQKMRRKTRALKRWQKRKGLNGEKAAVAFIRVFNRKLFEHTSDHELTWTRWYFPLINTTRSLEEIDHYAQECIRYLISDKRTKARFNVRYEEMKKLGYRSLVNAFYRQKNEQA